MARKRPASPHGDELARARKKQLQDELPGTEIGTAEWATALALGLELPPILPQICGQLGIPYEQDANFCQFCHNRYALTTFEDLPDCGHSYHQDCIRIHADLVDELVLPPICSKADCKADISDFLEYYSDTVESNLSRLLTQYALEPPVVTGTKTKDAADTLRGGTKNTLGQGQIPRKTAGSSRRRPRRPRKRLPSGNDDDDDDDPNDNARSTNQEIHRGKVKNSTKKMPHLDESELKDEDSDSGSDVRYRVMLQQHLRDLETGAIGNEPQFDPRTYPVNKAFINSKKTQPNFDPPGMKNENTEDTQYHTLHRTGQGPAESGADGSNATARHPIRKTMRELYQAHAKKPPPSGEGPPAENQQLIQPGDQLGSENDDRRGTLGTDVFGNLDPIFQLGRSTALSGPGTSTREVRDQHGNLLYIEKRRPGYISPTRSLPLQNETRVQAPSHSQSQSPSHNQSQDVETSLGHPEDQPQQPVLTSLEELKSKFGAQALGMITQAKGTHAQHEAQARTVLQVTEFFTIDQLVKKLKDLQGAVARTADWTRFTDSLEPSATATDTDTLTSNKLRLAVKKCSQANDQLEISKFHWLVTLYELHLGIEARKNYLQRHNVPRIIWDEVIEAATPEGTTLTEAKKASLRTTWSRRRKTGESLAALCSKFGKVILLFVPESISNRTLISMSANTFDCICECLSLNIRGKQLSRFCQICSDLYDLFTNVTTVPSTEEISKSIEMMLFKAVILIYPLDAQWGDSDMLIAMQELEDIPSDMPVWIGEKSFCLDMAVFRDIHSDSTLPVSYIDLLLEDARRKSGDPRFHLMRSKTIEQGPEQGKFALTINPVLLTNLGQNTVTVVPLVLLTAPPLWYCLCIEKSKQAIHLLHWNGRRDVLDAIIPNIRDALGKDAEGSTTPFSTVFHAIRVPKTWGSGSTSPLLMVAVLRDLVLLDKRELPDINVATETTRVFDIILAVLQNNLETSKQGRID